MDTCAPFVGCPLSIILTMALQKRDAVEKGTFGVLEFFCSSCGVVVNCHFVGWTTFR